MRLGELTTAHIARMVTFTSGGPARVVDSVRHFLVTDPDTKQPVRRTSVILRPTGAGGNNDKYGEHLGDSADEVTVMGNV